MRYHATTLPDGTEVSPRLQELFYQAGFQAHVYGCRKQHGREYAPYAELRAQVLQRAERELGFERSHQVLVALSGFERLAEEHAPASPLCSEVSGFSATTDPDFARSGMNADLLELLS